MNIWLEEPTPRIDVLAASGVCHERWERMTGDAVAKMRVGPSEPSFRGRLQTNHGCCVRKIVVVSEWEA
jgi:hypothetical protein